MKSTASSLFFLSIGVVATLLLAAATATGPLDDDDVKWKALLRELSSMEDAAAALERINVKAVELQARLEKDPTVTDRVRLAELLVQCKVPRVKMMAKGAASVEAIGQLEKAIEEEPDHMTARYMLAHTCRALPAFFGRADQAKREFAELYTRAVAAPDTVPFPDVYLHRAQDLIAGSPGEALEAARLGVKRFPKHEGLRGLLKKLEAAADGPERPGGESAVSPATAKGYFWAAFETGRLEYPRLERALRSAEQVAPDDPEMPLLGGLLRLWALSTRGEATAAARGERAAEAVKMFERSLQLNPDDTRVYGWLGPLKATLGISIGDRAMAEEGEAIMTKGVEAYPEQNLFGRVVADILLLDALEGEARLARVRRIGDDLYRTIELCVGEPMDRSRFLVPDAAGRARPAACNDTKKAAHNQSGTLFWAGEFFLGTGEHRKAVDAFGEALRLDADEQWPFRALAESRRARSLALLGGETPDEPAETAPSGCLLCHQAR